jgi:hypothetical protein
MKSKKYSFGGQVAGQPTSAFGQQQSELVSATPTVNVQAPAPQAQAASTQPGLIGLRAAGFKKGGKVTRGDGCAKRGKTKGKMR